MPPFLADIAPAWFVVAVGVIGLVYGFVVKVWPSISTAKDLRDDIMGEKPRPWRDAGRRARMYVYYAGMVGVGILGFTGDASPGVEDALGYASTMWIFSAGLIVLSVAAIAARRLRAADAEAVFVIGIGAATFVHGAALLSTGSAGWQSGARLLIAILMMWDWADYRRRETDLDQLVDRARDHL